MKVRKAHSRGPLGAKLLASTIISNLVCFYAEYALAALSE